MASVVRKTYSRFLCASALSAFVLFGCGSFAHAQQVEFTGDNGTYSGGCHGPRTVPTNCPSVMTADMPDSTQDHAVFSLDYQTGVMVGTNLTDAHGGSSAQGNASITGGGTVNSAFLYVGHEHNTSGSVHIEGAGSEWISYSGGQVGHYGEGEMFIGGGAVYRQVNTDYFYAGYGETGSGNIYVTGVDTASDTRSSLLIRNRMYIGSAGNATMRISDGGYVWAEFSSVLADLATAEAIMVVEGVHQDTGHASTYQVQNNQFWVGYDGKGTLHVLDGGQVIVHDGLQARGDGSIILVSGVDAGTGTRSTVTANTFQSGYLNTSDAFVRDGGLVHANSVRVGRLDTGNGTLTVEGVDAGSGERAEVWANTIINVGTEGTGHMIVRDGGLAHSEDSFLLGQLADARGVLTVQGQGSQAIANGIGTVGHGGWGELNIQDNGLFHAGTVTIAAGPDSVGTINIGTGGVAGVLEADSVSGGLGSAEFNFNHTNNIGFTPKLTGNIANVNKYNNSMTTLMAESGYTGSTNVLGGVLQAGMQGSFSANSGFNVSNGAVLDLNGHSQSIDSLNHAGILRFGGQGGTVLNIDNGLVSDGGVYEFNVVLGDDGSVTDMITATHTSGTGFIKVKNINGLGDVTDDGIWLIDTTGAHDGDFILIGDYMHEGKQAVVGGAYAYKLHSFQNISGAGGATFLQSNLIPSVGPDPLYQAGVPTYEIYPQSLLALNAVGTLQQRVGNRSWMMPDEGGISGNPGAGQQQHAMPDIERGGVWMRIDGAHHHMKPNASRSVKDSSQNIIKAQIGLEKLLSKSDSGKIIGGIHGQYSHGNTDISSIHGDGKISTDGYGIGLSATWYGNDHFYIDTQAQATWYRSDLHSKMTERELVGGNNGLGYGASIEAGKRIAIAPEWSITPQMQLSYSNVKFDSFDDTFDAHVSLQKAHVAQGRAGFSVEQEQKWTEQDSTPQRQHLYGIANIYYDLLHSTHVDVENTKFSSENDRLWGGVGVGGSRSWAGGKYSIYGEVTANTSLENLGDSYSAKGNIGFRIRW